jgi:4-methyl-5(b-hydroxyethyl)-thiazole monophosphate biosynthesis
MAKQVVVVLADGFEEIEAVTPIDVLRRAGLDVTVAGLGGTQIRGSHGVTYLCDAELGAVDATPDAIVLPGGLPGSNNLGESEAVKRLTQEVHESGGICAALCAAPALTLSPFGLLEGRVATCHPAFMDKLGGGATPSEERVVVDGNVVTSRGAGTAMDFSLKLAELLVDEKTAKELREAMVAGR